VSIGNNPSGLVPERNRSAAPIVSRVVSMVIPAIDGKSVRLRWRLKLPFECYGGATSYWRRRYSAATAVISG
jgi:hypothetical protein